MKKNSLPLLALGALGLLLLGCSTPLSDAPPLSQETPADSRSLEDYPQRVDQGAILHAFYWTFDEVYSRLDEISEAGYQGVQVGPVQRTKEPGDYNSWWLLYQPTSFRTIGNFQLGDETAFRSMTAKAQDLGIRVIVDVVLNHVADNGQQFWSSALDNELKNHDYYHWLGQIPEYRDRYWVTMGDLGGTPDLKTSHPAVQQLAVSFLNQLLDAGADGFRIDAAKHIETQSGQDAGQSWSSNYWDVVLSALSRKDIYLAGEVIANEAGNEAAYTQMFDITAHDYIWTLVDALRDRALNRDLQTIPSFTNVLAPEDALVYIENHDSFFRGETSWVDYQTRLWGTAILLARSKVVPLFFARQNEQMWKDTTLTQAVHFHRQMMGLDETFSNPQGSPHLLQIDRHSGNQGWGVFLLNIDNTRQIQSPTLLPDGAYTPQSGSSGTFTVSQGTLSGTLPQGITILTRPVENLPPPPPTGLRLLVAQQDSLEMGWNSVSGAQDYLVYRSGQSGGAFSQVGTVTGNDFTDQGLQNNQTYFYRVQARNALGTSALSTVLEAETQDPNVLGSNYSQMHLRGSFNSWGLTSMALIDHHLWEAQVSLSAQQGVQFKFDAVGDWSLNWGDNNGDGQGEVGGADVSFQAPQGGTYGLRFNDQSLNISVIFLSGGAPPPPKTIFRVHYNTGMGNFIALRGSVGPLSWTSGVSAAWTEGNVWVWETEGIPVGQAFEFKPLINDGQWSLGPNFQGVGGGTLNVYPAF